MDYSMQVESLTGALSEFALDPLGDGAPQAVAHSLGASMAICNDLHLRVVITVFHRQRVMIAVALAYQWLEDFIVPKLENFADILLCGESMCTDHWLNCLLHHIHVHIEGTGSVSIDTSQFIVGLTAKTLLKHRKLDEATYPGVLVSAMCDVLMTAFGFVSRAKTSHQYIAARFITHLIETVDISALLLDSVWEVFIRPDTKLLGCKGAKLHLQLEELLEWQVGLEAHPIAQPGTPERLALTAISNEFDRICEHKKMPAHLPLVPKYAPAQRICWFSFGWP
jgi:hypothetical protein